LILVGMPCFNRAAFTERTVRSLFHAEPRESYTLVCVNDASEDDTADILYRLQCEGLVDYVIDHKERQGVAASVNDAWRIGESDASAFVKLDNDSEILTPGLFKRLASTIAAFGSGVGMAAPQVDPGRPGPVVTAGDMQARRPPGNLNGACMYVTREAFERVGYFYEWPHPYSFSDAEYCHRCRVARLDHLYLTEKPGFWIQHLNDGDRTYLDWKLRMRKRKRGAWDAFRRDLNRGKIAVKQPFKITGER
jgi:GT2 family glycosyltransferase